MSRLALLLAITALLGASDAIAAQQPPGTAAPKPSVQTDEDLVLPPPHGAPKELATGATRGLGTGARTPAETVTEVRPAEPRTGTRAGPRSLTGAPPP